MIQINELNFEDTISRVNRVKLEQAQREKKANLAATVKKILADAALSENDSAMADTDWEEMADLRECKEAPGIKPDASLRYTY